MKKTREHLMKQEESRFKTDASTHFFLEISSTENLENRTCRFRKGREKLVNKTNKWLLVLGVCCSIPYKQIIDTMTMQGKWNPWAASSIALLVTENYAKSTNGFTRQDISYVVTTGGILHAKVSY